MMKKDWMAGALVFERTKGVQIIMSWDDVVQREVTRC